MAQLTAEQVQAEENVDLGILRQTRRTIGGQCQPSKAQWEMAAEFVVTATLASLSDIALAAQAGSDTNTPAPSVDTFVDDGTGPNRHIPRCVRYPVTPPSVLEAIEKALPGIALEEPACYRAASDIYGFWRCEVVNCGFFADPSRLDADCTGFLRSHAASRDAIVVDAQGRGSVVKNNPAGARAVIQLVACYHYETAHLATLGIELVVSPVPRRTDGQHVITWRWQPVRVAGDQQVSVAAAGDERRLTQLVRHWIAAKGVAVSERLRRPLLARYRKWARGDREARKTVVRTSRAVGYTDYEIAHELHTHSRASEREENATQAFDAHARAKVLREDIGNFDHYPHRPWPRPPPRAWDSLTQAQREELIAVWTSADHMMLVECERRVYGRRRKGPPVN